LLTLGSGVFRSAIANVTFDCDGSSFVRFEIIKNECVVAQSKAHHVEDFMAK
jgi:hypothetical protein